MGKKKSGHGKQAKKARQGQTTSEGLEEAYKKAPHTFVFHRGKVGKNVSELVRDMRRVMEPYTASSLQVRKKNVLKDFVSIAGPLNVTHFHIFTKTDIAVHFKVCRLPRGPTLTFNLEGYSLAKDVISSIKRHHMDPKQFKNHPLLVMNNFSGEGMQFKLMATMFQNMFPSINVNKVKLTSIRRCVLLNYNSEANTIDFRHYNITVVPTGASRGVKKMMKSKVPNLAHLEDMSEFLTRAGDLSESEAELDNEANEVILPQEMAGRGNVSQTKSAIRMTEIGPRMTMKLVKIEEGLLDGDVLYHNLIKKTPDELKEVKERRKKKKQEKAQRKKQQEEDIARKKATKDEHVQKTLAGMKRKAADEDSDAEDPGGADERHYYDDDVAYFKEEVGETPDQELMLRSSKSHPQKDNKSPLPSKRAKFDKTAGKKDKYGKKSKGKGDAENKQEKSEDKKGKKPLTHMDLIKRRKMRKEKGQPKRHKGPTLARSEKKLKQIAKAKGIDLNDPKHQSQGSSKHDNKMGGGKKGGNKIGSSKHDNKMGGGKKGGNKINMKREGFKKGMNKGGPKQGKRKGGSKQGQKNKKHR